MWETDGEGGGDFGGISEAEGGGVNLGSGYLSERTRREQCDGTKTTHLVSSLFLLDSCPELSPVFTKIIECGILSDIC